MDFEMSPTCCEIERLHCISSETRGNHPKIKHILFNKDALSSTNCIHTNLLKPFFSVLYSLKNVVELFSNGLLKVLIIIFNKILTR